MDESSNDLPPEELPANKNIITSDNPDTAVPGTSRENRNSDSDSDIKFHPYKKPKNKERDKPDNTDSENSDRAKWQIFLDDIQEPEANDSSSNIAVSSSSEEKKEEPQASTSRVEMTDDSDDYRRTRRKNPMNPNDVAVSARNELSSSSSESVSDISLNSTSSDSSTSSDQDDLRKETSKNREATPDVLLKPIPKHNWSVLPELSKREMGYSNHRNGYNRFQERMHGSLHSVQRLELMYKLQKHGGCVNGLNFNASGSLLASCSDDMNVCLWDWAAGKLQSKLKTGHKSNVFQSKFLPLDGHLHIATCSRDGQVRLLEVDPSGSMRNLRRMGTHSRPAHKLACVPGSPHCFMSCAEDALVTHFDVRQKKPTKVLEVLNDGKLIALFSLNCHPIDAHEFMVGGRDIFVRLYDRRNLSKPLLKLHPAHFVSGKRRLRAYISSSVYNYDGTQLLASYNDEDIYLWDRKEMSNADVVHRYQGHRNSATLKSVNFFGPRSEFVVSGSDCGNIFFWDRESEAIVKWMAGDENGVVNCLEPHPSVPVIATSGLDNDVKVWISSCESEPTFKGLKSTVITNHRDRKKHRSDTGRVGHIDAQMLWLLWRHLRRSSNRNGEQAQPAEGDLGYGTSPEYSLDYNIDSDSDQDADDDVGSQQCSPS